MLCRLTAGLGAMRVGRPWLPALGDLVAQRRLFEVVEDGLHVLGGRTGPEAVADDGAAALPLDEPELAQDAQVLGGRGGAAVDDGGEVVDAERAFGQGLDDAHARGLADGAAEALDALRGLALVDAGAGARHPLGIVLKRTVRLHGPPSHRPSGTLGLPGRYLRGRVG